MSNNIKENPLQKRAFDYAAENDIDGFLACLDEGYDVNASLLTEVSMWARSTSDDDRFEETLPSRALKSAMMNDAYWPLLKALIERYGAENLVFSDQSIPDPVEDLTNYALEPIEDEWPDLGSQTFESSAKHFCLWHICRPLAPLPAIITQPNLGVFQNSGFDLSLIKVQKEKDLRTFFRNCEALIQKKEMTARLEGVKECKPSKSKPSLM